MRIIKALALLLIGTSLFLTSCGGASAGTSPADAPADPPAAGSPPPMNMTPVPAQTAAAAKFTTSNLIVTPDKAKPGERVMVGVTVTNTGEQQGTYTVTVKDHDGTLLGTKDVTLAGGAKEDVTLHVSINSTGTHMVMVDKLYRDLVIQQDTAVEPPMQPMQPPPPAAGAGFVVSNLEIDPTMPDVGEEVIVSLRVRNTGAQQGTYKVVVKIDGVDAATKDVTVAAGATELVNVKIKAPNKEGSFKVTVGDQTVGMSVMAM